MNTNNTLHDKILAASKEIAADKGFQAINIRAVASKAKISVGSVYNYFPDKSALLQATIADIWCDVFHRTGQCTALSSFHGFLLCCLFFESRRREKQRSPDTGSCICQWKQ